MEYYVIIDFLHPRKSSCTCPHATGRRIVCKHMVALYCTAFPEDAYRYEKNEQEREAANERYYDELSYRIASHISNM